MFTDKVAEIDLYRELKKTRYGYYSVLEEIPIMIPAPIRRTVTLRLVSTKQRYGRRMWFLCHYCHHRVAKLYVHKAHFDKNNMPPIACRNCYQLKYSSQFDKHPITKMMVHTAKIDEVKKRRLYYSGRPTQFGRRYERLMNKFEVVKSENIRFFQRLTSRFPQ